MAALDFSSQAAPVAPEVDATAAPHPLLPLIQRLEDSGDDAVSPAGAVGRYQVMPSTARQFGFDPSRLTDPNYNAQAASAVLDSLHSRYGDDVPSILAAYNGGPGRGDAFKRSGYNLSVLPPETQHYVMRAYQQPQVQQVAATSSAPAPDFSAAAKPLDFSSQAAPVGGTTPVSGQSAPTSTAGGAFRRAAGRSLLPTAGGFATAGLGAEWGGGAGAALGAAIPIAGETGIPEAVGGVLGGIGGGLAGFIGGQKAVDYIQNKVLSALPESIREKLGQGAAQQQADVQQHPYAEMAGELAPSLLALRPGSIAQVAEDAPRFARIMGSPVAARAFPAALMGGQEAMSEREQGDALDPTKIAIATGAGALMNRETALGRGLSGLGARAGAAATDRIGLTTPHAAPDFASQAVDVGTATSAPPPDLMAPGSAPAAGSDVGLKFPNAPSRRATVAGYFDNGQSVRLRFDTGDVRDYLTSEVMRDLTEPPPPVQEAPAPGGRPQQLTQDERAAPPLEDEVGPESPRAAARRAAALSQPALAPEAIQALDLANRLEQSALRPQSGGFAPSAAERLAYMQQAASLRVKYGIPPGGEVETLPNAYQHPMANEPAAPLGELARARVENPELYQDVAPDVSHETMSGDAGLAAEHDVEAGKTEPSPTPAQIKAGNYAKGKINVQGLNISVETPRGTPRTGVGPDGQPWESVNPIAHYGYITKTGQMGADGEHIDTYVGPNPNSPAAYVVDQIDPATGSFDEHKVILGAGSEKQASDIYNAGFSDGSGPQRMGAITKVPVGDFKEWLKTGDTSAPFNAEADPSYNLALQDVRNARSRSSAGPDLLATIRGLGGIRLTDSSGKVSPEGTVVQQIVQGGQRRGLFNNRTGMTPDYLREALTQQGWFGDRDPGQTDLQPFYDMLDTAARGQKVYHPESDAQSILEGRAMLRDEMDRAGVTAGDDPAAAAKKLLEFRKNDSQAVAGEYADQRDGTYDEMSPATHELLSEYGYEPGADYGAEFEPHAGIEEPGRAAEAGVSAEPQPARPEGGAESAQGPEGSGVSPAAFETAEPREAAVVAAGGEKVSDMRNPATGEGPVVYRLPDNRTVNLESGERWVASDENGNGVGAGYGAQPLKDFLKEEPAAQHSVAEAPQRGARNPYQLLKSISSEIDRSVFKDIVPESIQRDGQRLIDAVQHRNDDVAAELMRKYERDAGLAQGGGGAGPRRVKVPRRGAVAVYNAAERYLASRVASARAPAEEPSETGRKFAAGEIAQTATGRKTSPFPKIDTTSDRRAGNTVSRVDKWLMQNALNEARARGDNFNARQFEANLQRPSQADKDSAEFYLFDKGSVQPVPKPLLKSITPEAAKVEPRAAVTSEPGASDAQGRALPQTVIPGMEQSARQAAAGREATGHGRIVPRAEQREPEGLFGPKPDDRQKTMFQAARAQTETPEFKRWFGDSKVVDETGAPKVVYHGTNQNIEAFSTKRLGANTGAISAKAFFFTEHPVEAGEYADMSARKQVSNAPESEANARRLLKAMDRALARNDHNLYEKLTLELEASEEEAMTGESRGANVLPVYLNIKNPLVVDMKGAADLSTIKAALAEAKKTGHDGLKLENVFDPVAERPGLFDTTQWVALRPEQIKSAVGNRGTFDPNNPNIMAQASRAKPFYSALTRGVEDAKINRAPASDWLGFIGNLKNKGVKQDEIDWSGVRDWLQSKTGPVTKDEVLQHLRENEVNVQEVTHGDVKGTQAEDAEAARVAMLPQVNEMLQRHGLMGFDRLAEARAGIAEDPRSWEYDTPADAAMAERYAEVMRNRRAAIGTATPKFAQYTLPGGGNYRELLLTLPPKVPHGRTPLEIARSMGHNVNSIYDLPPEAQSAVGKEYNKDIAASDAAYRSMFKGSHWDEPNVLAHVRFDDRTGPNGEKILHVSEIQSDWGQKLRREGAAQRTDTTGWTADFSGGEPGWWNVRDANGHRVATAPGTVAKSAEEAIANVAKRQKFSGVPDMPYKSTDAWAGLAVRRMLRYAAEHNYDKLTFDTGETNAARYDLSKQVQKLAYHDGKTLVAFDHNGVKVLDKDVGPDGLSDVIGKDAADRLMKQPESNGYRELVGTDLKMGGEGMKGFYDRILPQYLNKYAKKWGAKVEDSRIKGDADVYGPLTISHNGKDYWVHSDTNGKVSPYFDTAIKAMNARDEMQSGPRVHSIDITPSMKESVMQGQPLFQAGRARVGAEALPGERVKLADDILARTIGKASPEEARVLNAVEAEARRIVPSAKVQPTRTLEATPGFERQAGIERGQPISGANYFNGLKRIIAWSLESPDHVGTLRHEAIHYLRGRDLIRPKEWDTLAKAAETNNWMARHDIAARYPHAEPEHQIEEAVAEEFSQWRRAPSQSSLPKPVQGVFEKIADFLHGVAGRMREMLGRDVTSDDVFRRIASGEVGRRMQRNPFDREPTFAQAGRDQTKTPEFKRWFGDSKVVDEKGEPLRVYHGTPTPSFDKFKPQRGGWSGGMGMWFGSHPDIANQFATQRFADQGPAIYPAYLSLKNPKEFEGWDEYTAAAKATGKQDIGEMQRSLRNGLIRRGHDGIVIRGSDTDAGGVRDDYVAFEPEQIKSAVGNNGSFDPRDKRIQFQAGRSPEQPTVAPTGDERTDNVSDAIAADWRSKGPGAYARYASEKLAGAWAPGPTKTLGDFPRRFIFPRTLASLDWRSGHYYNAMRFKDEATHKLQADYRDHINGDGKFTSLPKESQDKILQAAELLRLDNRNLTDDGRSVVLRNEGHDLAALSRPGQSVVLNPKESKALFSLRDMFSNQWKDVIAGTAKKMGWDGAPDPDAIRRASEDQMQSPASKRTLARTADIIQTLQEQERAGYVPLMRFGDYYLAVKPKVGTDQESLGGYPKVSWYGRVDSQTPWEKVFGRPHAMGAKGIPENAHKAVAGLNALGKFGTFEFKNGKWESPTHEIEHGNVTSNPDALRRMSIPAVEKLMQALEHRSEGGKQSFQKNEAYTKLMDEIRTQLYEELKAGFKKRSHTVPGYDSDFRRAIGSYNFWISHHVGNMLHDDAIERARNEIVAHPDHNVRKFWDNWDEYQEKSPGLLERGANALKNAAFYWTMAGVPATTIHIMTHGPVVGLSSLKVGIPLGEASGVMMGAMRDTLGAMRADTKQGINYGNVSRIGRTPGERAFLDSMEREGLLHSRLSDEMGRVRFGEADWARGARGAWNRVSDVLSSNISAADRFTRIPLALSAYRLAERKGGFERFNKTWGNDENFKAAVRQYGPTPNAVGHFMVSEGAFDYGKRNMPEVGRGIVGGLLWQFHNFQTRALSKMLQLSTRMGPEGQKSAALMTAALMALTGGSGLWFSQDIGNLYDAAAKVLTGVDPNVKEKVRDWLENDAGWGQMGADMFLRGPISTMMGVDLTSRLGFGEPISREMQVDANNSVPGWLQVLNMAPAIGIASRAVMSSAERLKSHQGALAAGAEAAPAMLRYPIQGLATWPQAGVKTIKTGRQVVPASAITPADQVRHAMGWEPLDVSRVYEKRENAWRQAHARD